MREMFRYVCSLSVLSERTCASVFIANSSVDVVKGLAKQLKLERSLSSSNEKSSSRFHVQLPPASALERGRAVKLSGKNKRIIGLDRPLPATPDNMRKHFMEPELRDFVIVSKNPPPPTELPPPIPGYRQRE